MPGGTELVNTFEGGGGVSGGTISAANSGGGISNAFDAIDLAVGTGLVNYGTVNPYSGGMGMYYRIATGTSGNTGARWDTSLGTPGPDVYTSCGFRIDVAPAANGLNIVFRRPSDFSLMGAVGVNGSRQLLVYDASAVVVATSTTALSTGTWYRVEAHIFASLTVGYVQVRLYQGPTSTTILETINSTPSTWNTTSATVGRVFFGVSAGGNPYPTVNADQYFRFDNLRAGRTTTWYGPDPFDVINTVAPTVTGALTIGGTVTANPGTWTPTPSSFGYYWHRADDAAGTNLVEIGATGATYTLAAADANKYIRAGVIPVA